MKIYETKEGGINTMQNCELEQTLMEEVSDDSWLGELCVLCGDIIEPDDTNADPPACGKCSVASQAFVNPTNICDKEGRRPW